MCLPQDGVDGTREQSDRMLPSFIGTPSTDQVIRLSAGGDLGSIGKFSAMPLQMKNTARVGIQRSSLW